MVIYLKKVLNFFTGILLGAGAILPGVSSGVICVILGIYMSHIPDVIKNFRSSKMFKTIKVLNKMHSQSKTQKD